MCDRGDGSFCHTNAVTKRTVPPCNMVNYCKMLGIGEDIAHYLYNFGVIITNLTPNGYETDNHSHSIYSIITHHGISNPFFRK